jgi:hypothetical protein
MHAKPSKDIWSLGCVFSEAVYWSVFGPNGHREYQNMRRRSTVPHLKDSGYSGCFHNGQSIHAIVSACHRDAIHNRRTNIDDIVSNIVFLVEEMLGNEHERPGALEVHRRLTAALDLVTAPGSTSSSRRHPSSVHTPANGTGTRLPPPMAPDENALHLHLGSSIQTSLNIASGSHRGIGMTQPWTSHLSNPDHTWTSNPVASPGNRPANGVNVAQYRLSHGISLRDDHSPTTDLFDDKAFEAPNEQAGGFTRMPRDVHRPPLASGHHGRQLSSPENQTPLPTATVADVLDWINKKNLNSNLSFKDRDWLKVLHGRDQVSWHIHIY